VGDYQQFVEYQPSANYAPAQLICLSAHGTGGKPKQLRCGFGADQIF